MALQGVRFAVWAPNAQRVSVIGDWNGFDGRFHLMRQAPSLWRLGIIYSGVQQSGLRYKYEVLVPTVAPRPRQIPLPVKPRFRRQRPRLFQPMKHLPGMISLA